MRTLLTTFVWAATAMILVGCASGQAGNGSAVPPAELTPIATTVMAHLLGGGQLPDVTGAPLENPARVRMPANTGSPPLTTQGYVQVIGQLGRADRLAVINALNKDRFRAIPIEDPRIDADEEHVFDRGTGRYCDVYSVDEFEISGGGARVYALDWYDVEASVAYLFELVRHNGEWQIRRISVIAVS